MKIALGTAQFGLGYGIANTMGQLAQDEGRRVIALARSHGIDTLDTAIAYGESECSLGRIGVDDWKVVTKLPAIPVNCVDVTGWVRSQAEGSLRRLGVGRLYALLLHRPSQLLDHHGPQIFAGMQRLVAEGLVQKIGISIYDPSELGPLFERWHFDLVQAPFNVLDRRLLISGWGSWLKDRGVELHARSAFLQGLLLIPAVSRPAWFRQWDALWMLWDRWLSECGLTPVQACLRTALAVPEIDHVVVGVDSEAHLSEVLEAANGPPPPWAAAPQIDDLTLLNPAKWTLS
jgi:aryl-alcohol dehydrogenase-like predicted oxidoreductase